MLINFKIIGDLKKTFNDICNLQTVSLAKRSGSSRPRGGFVISRSQHRIKERNKCWIPSIHCTMIFAAR